MMGATRYDLVLLDAHWRPVDRVAGESGWAAAVAHILRSGDRWIALEQMRAAGVPVGPDLPDFALTRALWRRLRPLEIGLADHVIRAGGDRFSFRAAGLL